MDSAERAFLIAILLAFVATCWALLEVGRAVP